MGDCYHQPIGAVQCIRSHLLYIRSLFTDPLVGADSGRYTSGVLTCELHWCTKIIQVY